MAKPDRITKLSTVIKRREKEGKHALAQLNKFCKLFYHSVEDILSALAFKGVESVNGSKRIKTLDGWESLSFTWNGYRFTCIPCQGVALSPHEEAGMLGELARKHAGRLVMFAYSADEPESSITVCDHYVFPDGSWCACGIEHSAHADLDAREIAKYTLRLLSKLESQFALIWNSRHEVRFDEAGASCSRLVKHPILYSD